MILQIQLNPQQFRPRTTQSRALAQEEEKKSKEENTFEPGGISGAIGPAIEGSYNAFKNVFNFVKEPFLEAKEFLSPSNYFGNIVEGADEVPWYLQLNPMAMWLAGLKQKRRDGKLTSTEYHRQVRGGIGTMLTIASFGVVNPAAYKASSWLTSMTASKLLPTAPGQFLAKTLGKIGVKGALGERMARHSVTGMFDGAFFGGGFGVMEPLAEGEAVQMDTVLDQAVVGFLAGGVLGASFPVIGKGFKKATNPLRSHLTMDQRRGFLGGLRDEVLRVRTLDPMTGVMAGAELPKTARELFTQVSLGRFKSNMTDRGFFGTMRNAAGYRTAAMFNRYQGVTTRNPTLVQKMYDWLDAGTVTPFYLARKLNDFVLYDLDDEGSELFIRAMLSSRFRGKAKQSLAESVQLRAELGGAQTSMKGGLFVDTDPAGGLSDELLSAVFKKEQPMKYAEMRSLEGRARILRERADDMLTPEEIARLENDTGLQNALELYTEYVTPIFESLYARNGGKVKAMMEGPMSAAGAEIPLPFIHAVPVSSMADIDAWAAGRIKLHIPGNLSTNIKEKLKVTLGREATEAEYRNAMADRLRTSVKRRRYKTQTKLVGQAQHVRLTGEVIKQSPFAKEANFFAPAYHTDPNLAVSNALRIAMTVDKENSFIATLLLDPHVIKASKLADPPLGYSSVYIRGNAHVLPPRLRAMYDEQARQFNLTRDAAEVGLVGIDDALAFIEYRQGEAYLKAQPARLEKLQELSKHNLVDKAKAHPAVSKLFRQVRQGILNEETEHIPVETARRLFHSKERMTTTSSLERFISELPHPHEQRVVRAIHKGTSEAAGYVTRIQGQARALNRNAKWSLKKLDQILSDPKKSALAIQRLSGAERRRLQTTLEQSYTNFSAAAEMGYVTPQFDYWVVFPGALGDDHIGMFVRQPLKEMFEAAGQGSTAAVERARAIRNSIDSYSQNVRLRADKNVPYTVDAIRQRISNKMDASLSNNSFTLLDNNSKTIDSARKFLATESQDYLRKHLGLGTRFVVFRAETKATGVIGREHIPVATSLSPSVSGDFVDLVASVGKGAGSLQAPVQAYVVNMSDALFYAPAWRRTATRGAKNPVTGVAYGVSEEEIFIYADKLSPLDVPANASVDDIQRALSEQMGIHRTSRLAKAGKDIPKAEVKNPRYPGMDELDVEGLGGLGNMQPVLGRYFMPHAYAKMVGDMQFDPYRRHMARTLGLNSLRAQQFVDTSIPSSELARYYANYMDFYVTSLLATSVEVVAHSYRILGVLSRTPVNDLSGGAWKALVPYWGPRLKGLADMFHVMGTPDGIMMENRIGSVVGGGSNNRFLTVGNDLGMSVGSVIEKATGSKKAGHALEWGRDFLFGQPQTGRQGLYGFDQRARVAAAVNVNNIMKKRLQREMTDAELRHFLNGFGKYNENLQGNLFFLLRKSKLSPFAGGQEGMIPREIAQTITGSPGLPKTLMDELGAKVAWQLRGEVYARGIGGTAVWLTALQYAWTGTLPWDNEKGHKLDLKIGYLPDGRAVYLPSTTYMPGMSRALGLVGARALVENSNNPAAAIPEALMSMARTPITYGVAGAPGAGAGMTILMGNTTYLNSNGQFMKIVPPVSGTGLKKVGRQFFANASHAITGANPTIEELFGFTMEGETLPTEIRIINALTTGLKVGREPELAVSADVRQQRAAFFEATRSRVVEALATWPDNASDRMIYYRREAAKWDDPEQEKAALLNMKRNDISIRQARRRNARRAETGQPF